MSPVADRRVERLEVADVGVVEERVDEAVELAVRRPAAATRAPDARRRGRRRPRGPCRRGPRPAWPRRSTARSVGGMRTVLTMRRPASQASKAERLGRIAGASPGCPGRATPSPWPERPRVRRLEAVAGQQRDDLVAGRGSRRAGAPPRPRPASRRRPSRGRSPRAARRRGSRRPSRRPRWPRSSRPSRARARRA